MDKAKDGKNQTMKQAGLPLYRIICFVILCVLLNHSEASLLSDRLSSFSLYTAALLGAVSRYQGDVCFQDNGDSFFQAVEHFIIGKKVAGASTRGQRQSTGGNGGHKESKSPPGKSRPGRSRWLLTPSCCCRSCNDSDDEDDPDKHQPNTYRILSQCEANEIKSEDAIEDEPDAVASPNYYDGSTTAVEIHQVDTNPPGLEQEQASSWIAIADNVFISSDLLEGETSLPGNQIWVYVGSEHVPAIAKIAEDLICPVCLNPMSDPVTFCDKFHYICQSCTPGLESCPTCSAAPEKPLRVNKGVQRRIYQCETTCPHCNSRRDLSDIAAHIRSCDSRPKICFVCKTSCSHTHFSRHLYDCVKSTENQDAFIPSDHAEIREVISQLMSALAAAYIPQPREPLNPIITLGSSNIQLEPVPGFSGVYQEIGVTDSSALYFLVHWLDEGSCGTACYHDCRRSDAEKLKLLTFSFNYLQVHQNANNRDSCEIMLSNLPDDLNARLRLEILDDSGKALASYSWLLKPYGGIEYCHVSLPRSPGNRFDETLQTGARHFFFVFSVINALDY